MERRLSLQVLALGRSYPNEDGSGLPDVTADDNGDVLGVVDGAWAKMDAPSDLPSVTAEDNGKVLGVVNGKWNKTEGRNVVTYEVQSSSTSLTLANGKMVSDVKADIFAKKIVFLVSDTDIYVFASISQTFIVFYRIGISNANDVYMLIAKANANSTSNTLGLTRKNITTTD